MEYVIIGKIRKLENVMKEMERYNVSILGMAEVRRKEKGDMKSGDFRMIHSGGQETATWCSVAT